MPGHCTPTCTSFHVLMVLHRVQMHHLLHSLAMAPSVSKQIISSVLSERVLSLSLYDGDSSVSDSGRRNEHDIFRPKFDDELGFVEYHMLPYAMIK